MDYFCGPRKTPSMSVTRSTAAPLEIRIEAWPPGGTGIRKWIVTCAKGEATARHTLCDLAPKSEYKLSGNAARTETVRSDAEGRIAIECRVSDARPQTFEIKR